MTISPASAAALLAPYHMTVVRLHLRLLLLCLCVTCSGISSAVEMRPTGSARLGAALAGERFVAYVPRSFSVHHGIPQPASSDGIREDLSKLRPYFSGLITYGQGNGQTAIAGLAVEAGFRALILGIWDPTDRAELDVAIAAARRYPDHVVALVLGNEGLFWNRYSAQDLGAAAKYVRERLPQLPLGSSEPFALYLDSSDAKALLALDLLLPNLHPRFEDWFDPANLDQSVDFVAEVLEKLHARTAKPILVKETGLPSGPDEQGFTESRQADFWARLMDRIQPGPLQNIAGFEAFDAPWKPRELQDEFGRLELSEARWGMFRQDGSAKPVIERLGRWPVSVPVTESDSR